MSDPYSGEHLDSVGAGAHEPSSADHSQSHDVASVQIDEPPSTLYESELLSGTSSGQAVATIHGDAPYDAQFWHQQSESGFCAVDSVGMVVEEFTGQVIPEADLVVTAHDMHVLDGQPGAWSGMNLDGTQKFLEQYGISSHVVSGGTLADLSRFLDEGRKVIAAVDSDQFWTGQDQNADPRADHAVVVTSIDEGKGLVYFDDPGSPGGQGYTISIDQFQSAWSGSGDGMVVTDQAPPPGIHAPASEQPAVQPQPQVQPGAQPQTTGIVLLPIVFTPEGIQVLNPVEAPANFPLHLNPSSGVPQVAEPSHVEQPGQDPTHQAPSSVAPSDTTPSHRSDPTAAPSSDQPNGWKSEFTPPTPTADPVTNMVQQAEYGFETIAEKMWHMVRGANVPLPRNADGSIEAPPQIVIELLNYTKDPDAVDAIKKFVDKYEQATYEWVKPSAT